MWRTITFFLIAILATVALAAPKSKSSSRVSLFSTAIEDLLPSKYTDCGEAHSSPVPPPPRSPSAEAENAARVDECAATSFLKHQAFVATQSGGLDSAVVSTLVGDRDGRVFSLFYDSNICGGANSGRGCGIRVLVQPCKASIEGEHPHRRLVCGNN